MRRLHAALLLLLATLFFGGTARGVFANAAQDEGESSSKRDSGPLPKDSAIRFDPDGHYAADKDIDVGVFYAHKGNVDAAIGRYQDAADVAPKYARPRLLLAEAFEKKGDKTAALKHYREYLQLDPGAADKQKIEKKIEKLSAQ